MVEDLTTFLARQNYELVEALVKIRDFEVRNGTVVRSAAHMKLIAKEVLERTGYAQPEE